MNVLIVSQYFWPEPFKINDLVLNLKRRGHTITVLTGMPNYPEGRLYPGYGLSSPLREQWEEIQIVRAPLITRGRAAGMRLAMNYLSFALSACILGPLLCRGRFDVILVYEPSPITVGFPGLLMGWLKHAPVLLWVQDLWPETVLALGQRKWLVRLAALFANFVHHQSDLLLLQSEAFAQPLMARGTSRQRLRYFPNWAEDFYKPSPEHCGIDPLPQIQGCHIAIVFAGSIGGAQSFETILDAAQQLRDREEIHWIILGDGIMRLWVEEQIRSRGLGSTVKLLGRYPPEQMPAFFSRADALLVTLLPDPVFALTIPSKIQSYLAAGRPIIGALDGEGARIIAESGAGLVANAGDAQGLAQCVLKIAAMTSAERTAMGQRGRAYFENHFNREKLVGQLETWMHELIETRHADSDTRR